MGGEEVFYGKKQKQIDTVKELPTSDEISINIPKENDKIDEINA